MEVWVRKVEVKIWNVIRSGINEIVWNEMGNGERKKSELGMKIRNNSIWNDISEEAMMSWKGKKERETKRGKENANLLKYYLPMEIKNATKKKNWNG